jgi:hypothetical protein
MVDSYLAYPDSLPPANGIKVADHAANEEEK